MGAGTWGAATVARDENWMGGPFSSRFVGSEGIERLGDLFDS